MSEELLDKYSDEKVSNGRRIATVWIIFTVLCLYVGISSMFQFTFLIEFIEIPVHFAIESIFTGTFSFLIGICIWNNRENILELLLVFIGIIIIFSIVDIINFEKWDYLFWQTLISAVLILFSLGYYMEALKNRGIFEKRWHYLLLPLIGFLPYILSEYII
jgi:hypothetical protein